MRFVPVMLFTAGVLVGLVVAGAVVFGDKPLKDPSTLDCSSRFGCSPVELNTTIDPLSCNWDVAGFDNFDADASLTAAEQEECGGRGYVTDACSYSLYMLSRRMGCAMSAEGYADVTLVTDPANYVTAPVASAGYRETVVSSGELQDPWDIAFLPDGTPLVTEKDGSLNVILEDGPRTLGRITTEVEEGTGLHGIAVDPSFNESGAVYLLYTYDVGEERVWNRISRFQLEREGPSEEELRLGKETILVDGILGSAWHNGGRLKIGPDGRLYATTGDANIFLLGENRPQKLETLEGKVLRMNRDGSVPVDNPFPDSLVYTYGHRNPQGLAWHPVTNTLYTTEHGPFRFDEINVVQEPGSNFGWGVYKCDEPLDPDRIPPPGDESIAYTSPMHCFDAYTMAPSGAAFVDDPDHPWYGDLFVAGLRGKHIHRFINGTDRHDIFFIPRERRMPNRLRNVAFHDGRLWILGDDTGIMQLVPADAS